MVYYNVLKFIVKSVLYKKNRNLFFKCVIFVGIKKYTDSIDSR